MNRCYTDCASYGDPSHVGPCPDCERQQADDDEAAPSSVPPRHPDPRARSLVVALLLALSSGCALEPVPVRLFDTRTGGVDPETHLSDEVDEACAILGLDCYAGDGGGTMAGRGAITLTIFDAPDASVLGRTQAAGACWKAAWAVNDPMVIAHEIGHTFGIDHVDDPDNVMHPRNDERSPDATLDDEQLERLHRRTARFVAGCNPP